MALPRLTFFCELEAEPLQALLDDDLIADLVALKASLSLGILDLTPERAQVVRRLNQAGVPVIAWLLLPREQGYWFNLYNAPQAVASYTAFKSWAVKHGLRFDGVGLDIEPDIREITQLAARQWRVLPGVLRRVVNYRAYREARRAYQGLVEQIRADGFRVDSYQFPVITDERQVRSTFLQRLTGLVDISVDREVWMLYSTLARPNGAGLIASYAPQAQSIGLGSTGGGMDVEFGEFAALNWDELARDLRLAWYWCDDLHIFSLEGCVEQGFLERLKSFVWDYPILMPQSSLARIEGWRRALRSSLWITAHTTAVVLLLTGLFMAWRGLRRSWQRK